MNYGQGIGIQSKTNPGAVGAGSAANGLSVSAGNQVVLGDDPGGVLATLLNNRELQLNGNAISFIGTANFSQIDISENILAARMGQGAPNQGTMQIEPHQLIFAVSDVAPNSPNSQLDWTPILFNLRKSNSIAELYRFLIDAVAQRILLHCDDAVNPAVSLELSGGNLLMNGTPGFSGTVANPSSITVVNGIVTNVLP